MTPELHKEFSRSAELFPHMLDVTSDQVLLSRLSEEDYRKASFLDQRIITPELIRKTVPWTTLEAIPLASTSKPLYIFHIGHVGSTLLSRLLGETPGILALREPHILRSLADIAQVKDDPCSPWSPAQYNKRLTQTASWLSRTFHPKQTAMIKASSFVSEIAQDLLRPGNKALFLYVSLPKYLETIMAGDNSRKEAEHLAGVRLGRLNKKLGAPIANLWELSHTQRVALGWLCEMATLMQASIALGSGHIRWQNFDAFLENPVPVFLDITKFFDLDVTPESASARLSGPLMKTYSKAPEHDYSPDLRQQLLEQARREFGADMQKATQWVIDLAGKYALIDEIMTFCAGSQHV